MNRDWIAEVIGEIDERHVSAVCFDPPGQTPPERIVLMTGKSISKRAFSVLLAAALIFALGVTAYAVGSSIHKQRQAEIREQLQIDENKVEDYVEYQLPEDASGGLILLSTINTGEHQRIYYSISPVEEETIALLDRLDAGEEEESQTDYEIPVVINEGGMPLAMPAHGSYRDSYDAETKTLTLKTSLKPEDGLHIDVRLLRIPAGAESFKDAVCVIDYGEADIEATEHIVRTLIFPEPLRFENPETGSEGKILGVEVSAEGITWLLQHDAMDSIYGFNGEFANEEERESFCTLQSSWLNAINHIEISTVLHFADGSEKSGFSALRVDVSGGIVRDIYVTEQELFPLDEIESVTIDGQTFVFEGKES